MSENTNKKPGEKGQQYIVPPEGSLGLLALGIDGLRAWRSKREMVKSQQKEKGKGEDGNG